MSELSRRLPLGFVSRAHEIATDYAIDRIPTCALTPIPSRAPTVLPLQSILKFAVFVATIALVGWFL